MNVGIMYPRSKAHPLIMQDLVDGIKAFLAQQQPGTDINLISESVGYGGGEKEVYEKAEKLLMLEGVDVLVAFIGEKVMPILHPLLQASGKLMLAVHPGANYPESWLPQDNIIQLTLQEAFLCSLCGKDARKGRHAAAMVASTFYDCGYLHLAMMVDGFTQNSGSIVFNYINKQAYDDSFNIDELDNFLKEAKVLPALLCLFDQTPAALYYDRLNKNERAAELDLFVSPMMLQPEAFSHPGDPFKFSITGYSPWQAGIETTASREFCDAFLAKTKRKPSIFSLLGWEAGMILKQVADTVSSGYEDGAAIAKGLQNARFNSPRGEMLLDPQTNYFLAPVVHCSMAGNTDKMITKQLDLPLTAWADYIQLPTEGAGSGWTNTYLCY